MELSHKKPIIGIVPDLVKEAHNKGFPVHAVRSVYTETILRANAVPLVLPYHYDTIKEVLSIIDGLMLIGGGDVDPKFYGEEANSKTTPPNDARDEFEIFILKEAINLNLPILGICRGMQILNIVYGGTLIQHIPDYMNEHNIESNINHVQTLPKNVVTHTINIVEHTKLAAIFAGNSHPMVNSTHHQAVKDLGKGLMISATAEDGIIEAIEAIEKNFVMGIQWHPEYLNPNNIDLHIFKKFIESATKYCESK